jgi:hypothetical protein
LARDIHFKSASIRRVDFIGVGGDSRRSYLHGTRNPVRFGKRRLMMNSQHHTTLHRGQVLRLTGEAGELAVLGGRVWLTRSGDPDDYVLTAGERLRLDAHDEVVLEAWQRGAEARVSWQPHAQTRRAAALPRTAPSFGLALRGLA